MLVAALTISTSAYSLYYVVRHTSPSHPLKLSALIIGGLIWDVIILPWSWFVYTNFRLM